MTYYVLATSRGEEARPGCLRGGGQGPADVWQPTGR